MENKKVPVKFIKLTLAFLALCLVIYNGHRAAVASMTMDESSTYINHVPKSLIDIVTNEPIPDGNNHILNTLLAKVTTTVLPPSSFSLRLPSVLALALYLFFGLRIIFLFNYRPFLYLLGFCVLILNPYQFDFFTVGRGYGLGMAMMTGSIYFWFRFLEYKKKWQLASTFAFAILAVYSNFVWLNYFLAILGSYIIWWIIDWRKNQSISKSFFIPLTSIFLLGALIYNPLSKLQQSGLFQNGYWGQSGFWSDTVMSILKGYYYSASYLPSHLYIDILSWLIPALLIVALIVFLIEYIKNNHEDGERGFHLNIILFTIATSTITQHFLFGTDYLFDRTVMIYCPILALILITFFAILANKFRIPTLWLILSAFFIFHFIRTHKKPFIREWFYSEHTKEVVKLVNELKPEGPIKMRSHWRSMSSANFYRMTIPYDRIEWIPWENEIKSDTTYDFYYLPQNESSKLNDAYQLVDKFGDSALYQKK